MGGYQGFFNSGYGGYRRHQLTSSACQPTVSGSTTCLAANNITRSCTCPSGSVANTLISVSIVNNCTYGGSTTSTTSTISCEQ